MRADKRKSDMQHKHPKKVRKAQKMHYQLNEPIRSNPNETQWQLEQRKLKQKKRDQIR